MLEVDMARKGIKTGNRLFREWLGSERIASKTAGGRDEERKGGKKVDDGRKEEGGF